MRDFKPTIFFRTNKEFALRKSALWEIDRVRQGKTTSTIVYLSITNNCYLHLFFATITYDREIRHFAITKYRKLILY